MHKLSVRFSIFHDQRGIVRHFHSKNSKYSKALAHSLVLGLLVFCASLWAVDDTVPPQLVLEKSIPTPDYDATPAFTMTSSEAGKIAYAGDCSSSINSIKAGIAKTITLNSLKAGTHNNCTLTVRDAAGNVSMPLALNSFTIGPVPVLSSISPEYRVAGNEVMVSGHNLGGATVMFNDAVITPLVKTANSIVFVVPDVLAGNYVLKLSNSSGSVSKTIRINKSIKADNISAGNNHSCAVTAAKRIQCWGDNFFGQLGNNTLNDALLPVFVAGIFNAANVSAGARHSCAVMDNGSVKCWGDNQYGQLGNGTNVDSAIPVVVSGLSTAIAVSTGNYHACALLSNGSVQCWGANYTGQLGSGVQNYYSQLPVKVKNITTAIAISNGDEYSCALMFDKTVSCWGDNSHGELGNGLLEDSYEPVLVTGLANVNDIATGADVACASDVGGNAFCWGGYNALLQAYITAPQQIAGVGQIKQIDMGSYRVCAVLQDNSVACWSSNFSAELFTVNRVGNIQDVMEVNVGGGHVCAILGDRSIKCWGQYDNGQLGKVPSYQYKAYDALFPYDYPGARSVSIASNPVTVSKIANVQAFSAGGYHQCAVMANGNVKCQGNNQSGQLGDGTTDNASEPVLVAGINDAVEVSVSSEAGAGYSCMIHADATVSCWGYNRDRQLGNALVTDLYSVLPVKVDGIRGAQSISTGAAHACVKLLDKSVKCWGNNQYGQLGNGSNSLWGRPVSVFGINNAVAVKAGAYHSCALLDTGVVSCWGDNQAGQLGNGTTLDSFIPVPVIALGDVKSFGLGGEHSCAVSFGGMVQCWGSNNKGQIGNGSVAGYAVIPFPVAGIRDAAAVGLGDNHACALLKSDQIRCWGYGKEGQLGNGQLFDKNSPVMVQGIYAIDSIEMGADNSCAVLKNRAVQCWGYDARQLMTAPNAPVL